MKKIISLTELKFFSGDIINVIVCHNYLAPLTNLISVNCDSTASTFALTSSASL
jgi:hypothetical protein